MKNEPKCILAESRINYQMQDDDRSDYIKLYEADMQTEEVL